MQDNDSKQGYIYVLGPKGNRDFEVCKIGRTGRTPADRCAEINNDSTTGDFVWEVTHNIGVSDCMRLEGLAHDELSAHRMPGREVFFVSADMAMAGILRVLERTPEIAVTVAPATAERTKKARTSRNTHSARIDPYLPLLLRFVEMLGVRGELFNQRSKPYFGISDAAKGVQWNLAVYPQMSQIRMGVNLEGVTYRNWPITTLIQSEQTAPRLPGLAECLSEAGSLMLRFSRDAWQGASRQAIAEQWIGGEELPLDALTPEKWQAMLTEALGCLDATRQYRGRAEQVVTRTPSGEKKIMEISPHLTISTPLDADCDPMEALGPTIKRLKSLHTWARQASGA
ncbi:GIY-YIG nuclease family protein [Paraburkholderia sp. MM6662-R1]|uniref:GIY-YIG nuclease family protein n=1 Tax=Paraburkholderia sp. MM6662-R1 TaxID=2991066 RepID=UPI003D2376E3